MSVLNDEVVERMQPWPRDMAQEHELLTGGSAASPVTPGIRVGDVLPAAKKRSVFDADFTISEEIENPDIPLAEQPTSNIIADLLHSVQQMYSAAANAKHATSLVKAAGGLSPQAFADLVQQASRGGEFPLRATLGVVQVPLAELFTPDVIVQILNFATQQASATISRKLPTIVDLVGELVRRFGNAPSAVQQMPPQAPAWPPQM